MYPRIGFFGKMTYPRIRIGPIPIRVSVSVSVLHRQPQRNSSRACGNETTTRQKVFVQRAITFEIFKSKGEEK